MFRTCYLTVPKSFARPIIRNILFEFNNSYCVETHVITIEFILSLFDPENHVFYSDVKKHLRFGDLKFDFTK